MKPPKFFSFQKISLSPRWGYAFVIASAALAGLIHSVSKPILEYSNVNTVEINPLTFAAIIFIINGAFFTPIRKNGESVKKIGKKNYFLLGIIGIIEVLAISTYFFGLKESTAVNASILTNGEIIFSILIALVVFREKLGKKEIPHFSMIIIGASLLPIGYDLYQHEMNLTDLVFGDLLILLAGLLYAVDINMCKHMTGMINAKKITQITSFAGGGFALFLILVFQIPFNVSISHIPNIAVVGIFGTGLSTYFFIIALRSIGAVRTILLYSSTSVFGMLFATLILREVITLQNVLSIALVLAGLYFLRNRLSNDKTAICDLGDKFKRDQF
ncbi:MAG TPA: DMT family transporter [Nitrosopumilaceae archaeon]|nr:DMT family transporter [Nitrosopumilaceae archaeon]